MRPLRQRMHAVTVFILRISGDVRSFPKLGLPVAMAILLMTATTGIQSQINSGYIIGLNLSTMSLKASGINIQTKTFTAVHFGRIFEIPLTHSFALLPGLLFSAKGLNYKIDSAEFSISPIYIEIPAIAVLSFGTQLIKISLFAGTYLACGVGGTRESGGELKRLRFGSGENKDMKLFDIGFNFGAGIIINGLMISGQYELGLANLSPAAATYSEMKNKVIGISLAAFFSSK